VDPDRFRRAREAMVTRQLEGRGIRDRRVLSAMRTVPRHLFVPPHLREVAYADNPLPIGEGQTISQPYMVAVTCQRAALRGPERVLEIGAGSGYQAAVLGALASEVVAVERVPELVAAARANLAAAGATNVEVIHGDGSLGYASRAPYDAIVVAAAAPDVPPALVEQLAPGGRLVLPLGTRFMQELTVIEKRPEGLVRLGGDPCVFVPLVGEGGWDEGDAGGRRW
jgi:protein-L-isoaspartate(D-aspartate) O-methyltransferase